MNYKKGITRLFIIGLFLAPLVGLFNDRQGIENTQFYLNTVKSEMIDKLSNPKCAEVVKDNPSNFSDTSLWQYCYPLSGRWEDVKKYQLETGDNGLVTKKVVEDAMTAYIDSQTSSLRWEIFLEYLGGYLIFCLLGLIGFFIAKWVIKGFKSQ